MLRGHPRLINPPVGWLSVCLQVEVLRFVHVVTVLALATGVAFYVIAVARGGNPLAMFISCFVVRAAAHTR